MPALLTPETACLFWLTPTTPAGHADGRFVEWGGSGNPLRMGKRPPTATAGDASQRMYQRDRGDPRKPRMTLAGFVRRCPTPIARDARSPMGARSPPGHQGTEPLVVQLGGRLNPDWEEWYMGFPIGMTNVSGRHGLSLSGTRLSPCKCIRSLRVSHRLRRRW